MGELGRISVINKLVRKDEEPGGPVLPIINVSQIEGYDQSGGGQPFKIDEYVAKQDGQQSIVLEDSTSVLSVGKCIGNQLMLLPGLNRGWNYSDNSVLILSSANIATGDIIQIVHNGKGILPGETKKPAAPTNPNNIGTTFVFTPAIVE